MILTTVIVDDEPPISEEIEYLLGSHPDIKVVARFEQPPAALDYIAVNAPRLVFLDISLPGISGLEMAARLSVLRDPPLIVFITAHPEYALAAFETPAVGYVTKPVTDAKIAAVLGKVRRLSARPAAAPKEPAGKVCVLSGGRIVPLSKEDIALVQVREKTVYVLTKQGQYAAPLTMQEIENLLTAGRTGGTPFVRVHRQYIVNLDKVVEIIPWFKGTYFLKMDDCKGQQIPVSRHKVCQVKAALGLK
ncbi:LytR/AlgR family response regulator transcription factor [Anaeroselena agilis]|uniref:LytTR family DNA-binding domain-containing protein n=1 Tax=Anaeroselena agilis TaxID=3063788 RepID=A0ABU3P4X9_9FIRM|nr:LytTR family DNA-binding domain-containing protein [Selenomonadales bacterium 4137-cl]